MLKLWCLVVLGGFGLEVIFGETFTAIPENLLNCYRSNVTKDLPQPPLTTKLLIELIRKLEFDKSSPHIRTLTNAVLHTAKYDGVRRTGGGDELDGIIPYRASGEHFYKYQFIVDHLTPGDTLQFPRDAINEVEFCILHLIVSNTIDQWPNKSCKDCIVEQGVLWDKWGSISGGHLITGLASALQKEKLTLGRLMDNIQANDTFSASTRNQIIDNVLFSTIVGDLAEVLIRQGVDPVIGVVGNWNDTLLPRLHYLEVDAWDMSGAELLAGIDAILLADRVKDWLDILEGIRLSQLIDMYYSDRGVAFDRSYRACERFKKLQGLFDAFDLVDYVSAAAKILQTTGRYGVYLEENAIDKLAFGIVDSYKKTAELLGKSQVDCDERAEDPGRMELIVILDGTWQSYNIHQFASYGGEVLQENISANVSDDTVNLEFQRSDGTLVTQLIDFRN
ncbi:PREDICTED: uncharacterized protein LOC108564608, partial [Nicrophorus vespilloides]|uniref:Uncharacterized protein LOC108564608 n=1 Tax=Nicrophorus vespilloides TaxID=110193 RepID=A0ABM1MX98_NICVS